MEKSINSKACSLYSFNPNIVSNEDMLRIYSFGGPENIMEVNEMRSNLENSSRKSLDSELMGKSSEFTPVDFTMNEIIQSVLEERRALENNQHNYNLRMKSYDQMWDNVMRPHRGLDDDAYRS
mmetsp:Transcript_7104/g.8073  ORF Transcript_7104/g.8073 Transcript_7104/m.8073 type:complete len:123 (+) Transcript_7104:270-638(+)